MKAKTKIVEIAGTRYQVRKLAPDVGSYILGHAISAVAAKAASKGGEAPQKPAGAAETETAAMSESTAEDLVRAVALASFSGLDFETHKFVQQKCLGVCSRMEGPDGQEVPMPIVSDSGQWAIPEIRDDMTLVMRLEIEAMVFNLTDFFAGGGLNVLAGSRASKA